MPIIVFFLLSTALACIAMAWLPEIALIPAIAWGGILIVSALYLEEKNPAPVFIQSDHIVVYGSINSCIIWLFRNSSSNHVPVDQP